MKFAYDTSISICYINMQTSTMEIQHSQFVFHFSIIITSLVFKVGGVIQGKITR